MDEKKKAPGCPVREPAWAGTDVTVADMMEARDRRAERQRALLLQYGETLLCFTMNIPGPVKDSPLIREGFALGRRALRRAFLRAGIKPLHQEESLAFTGCEAFCVLPFPPLAVKRLTAEIEEASPLGRLFDLDVLRPDGTKVDRQEIGLPGRRCLLCGEIAQACARARRHTVPELQEKTREILETALREAVSERIASLACRALLYEVNVTPKPGLVDRQNSGSHRDMDCFTFSASATALFPYFSRCAAAGFDLAARPAPETFAAIRPLGKEAEGAMLEATGGVNTHKGAIFSLGLLSAAAGRQRSACALSSGAVLDICREMAAGLTERDFSGLTAETARTAGQRLFLAHGITGVRGQAEAGFPLIRDTGLPKLRAALAAGRSVNEAGCAALIALMAQNTDTNVIHRGSLAAQRRVAEEAARLLEGEPVPSRESLEAFDRQLIAENLSPGGSADLLSLCFFLLFLKEDA